jgi:hypothetical protein
MRKEFRSCRMGRLVPLNRAFRLIVLVLVLVLEL